MKENIKETAITTEDVLASVRDAYSAANNENEKNGILALGAILLHVSEDTILAIL